MSGQGVTGSTTQVSKGFTLIETLIYLALFTLVLGGLVVAAYALFETNGTSQTRSMLQEEKEYLIAKVSLVLDRAKAVTILAPDTLQTTTFANDLVTVYRDGTDLRIAKNGVPVSLLPLNNSNVAISQLVFTYTTDPDTVKMTGTIRAHAPIGPDVVQTAVLTKTLRK